MMDEASFLFTRGELANIATFLTGDFHSDLTFPLNWILSYRLRAFRNSVPCSRTLRQAGQLLSQWLAPGLLGLHTLSGPRLHNSTNNWDSSEQSLPLPCYCLIIFWGSSLMFLTQLCVRGITALIGCRKMWACVYACGRKLPCSHAEAGMALARAHTHTHARTRLLQAFC